MVIQKRGMRGTLGQAVTAGLRLSSETARLMPVDSMIRHVTIQQCHARLISFMALFTHQETFDDSQPVVEQYG